MTVEELAAEMGIDLATAKPEGVAKFRVFVADADKKYGDAKTLAAQAEANLVAVQKEQDDINNYIAQYGTSEESSAALRANYAAMEAQLKSLKEQGLAVNLPPALTVKTGTEANKPTFDPEKFRGSVSSTIAQLTDLSNKHLWL
jgi:hypothetical protein